jgi:hypothetical protein
MEKIRIMVTDTNEEVQKGFVATKSQLAMLNAILDYFDIPLAYQIMDEIDFIDVSEER